MPGFPPEPHFGPWSEPGRGAVGDAIRERTIKPLTFPVGETIFSHETPEHPARRERAADPQIPYNVLAGPDRASLSHGRYEFPKQAEIKVIVGRLNQDERALVSRMQVIGASETTVQRRFRRGQEIVCAEKVQEIPERPDSREAHLCSGYTRSQDMGALRPAALRIVRPISRSPNSGNDRKREKIAPECARVIM